MGQRISISAGDGAGTFAGYLALPPTGRGPGIVLCHEIFGANATMRQTADSLAEAGYSVLLPDLFWRLQPDVALGYTPEERQVAMQLYHAIDEERAVHDVDAAVHALRPYCDESGKIGVLGYCMGGKLAYLAACRLDIACAISYYGVGIERALDEAPNVAAQLVLHMPAKDAYCPPPVREQIQAVLARLPAAQTYVYPDDDHAFARVGTDRYREDSAQLAHQRSLAALRRALGPA